MRIFTNGVFAAAAGTEAGAMIASDNTARLFVARKGHPALEEFYHGYLDEVRLYDRALTTNQISELATSTTVGLEAYYPLANGSANDAGGQGKHGSVNGTAPALDRNETPNQAFAFNGNANVNLTNRPITGVQSNFSFAAWFHASNTTWGTIYEHRATNRDVGMYWSAAGAQSRLIWRLIDTSGGPHDAISAVLPANQWIHCVGTYDGMVLRLYTNGVFSGATNWAQINDWNTGFANEAIGTGFGANGTSPINGFQGRIDEVRFYSRTLSSNDVAALYSSDYPIVVFGNVSYSGKQTNLPRVVAGFSASSWETNLSVTVSLPSGDYSLPLPAPTNYWIRAFIDSDGDGTNDVWETQSNYVNNPVFLTNNFTGLDIVLQDPDTDNDDIPDWWTMRYFQHTNGQTNDMSLAEDDPDSDFFSNRQEFLNGTDPKQADDQDTDGDGIPDGWEIKYGLNPSNSLDALTSAIAGELLSYLQKYNYRLKGSTNDSDGDGLTDYAEIFLWHSDPLAFSTLNDGTADGEKVLAGRDPTLKGTRYYYDKNDRLVGAQHAKGLSLGYQYDANGNILRQVYLTHDSTTNGLPDLYEFLNGLTNNTSAYTDTDGDGWTDYQEWRGASNPLRADSIPTNALQTAPIATVLQGPNIVGNIASLTLRLWDAEGNDSTPYLRYQISGTTNWLDATVWRLDGLAYSTNTRVAATPVGTNHTLIWNVGVNLGFGISTNVLLSARATDVTMDGRWSPGTPFSIQTTANTDSDNDGIPDWWEIEYFGNTSRNGNGDWDGDGVGDLAEYTADTNPTNSASYLRFTSAIRLPAGVVLNWQGGSNATQFVESLSNLTTNNWLTLSTNLPPTPISGSYTDSPGTNAAQFYRIKATR